MPLKRLSYRKTKPSKRRTIRRWKRKSRITQNVSSKVGTELQFSRGHPFPPFKKVALRYVETINCTTGAAGVSSSDYYFRLGSLYDPNQTGTGHQPYGFDTITGIYSYYRVDSARVTLIWSTIGGTADLMPFYCVNPSAGNISFTGMTADYVAEKNNVSCCVLSPSGVARTVKQTVYIPLHKIEGITRTKYMSEDNYSALYNANPAKNINFQIGVASPSGTASEACTCQVIIDYYATFFGRDTLTTS